MLNKAEKTVIEGVLAVRKRKSRKVFQRRKSKSVSKFHIIHKKGKRKRRKIKSKIIKCKTKY